MREELQPETLKVIINPANKHTDFDGTTGCEGGARSSSRHSITLMDFQVEDAPPIDERLKGLARRLIAAMGKP